MELCRWLASRLQLLCGLEESITSGPGEPLPFRRTRSSSRLLPVAFVLLLVCLLSSCLLLFLLFPVPRLWVLRKARYKSEFLFLCFKVLECDADPVAPRRHHAGPTEHPPSGTNAPVPPAEVQRLQVELSALLKELHWPCEEVGSGILKGGARTTRDHLKVVCRYRGASCSRVELRWPTVADGTVLCSP